jgi:hypothetical protein
MKIIEDSHRVVIRWLEHGYADREPSTDMRMGGRPRIQHGYADTARMGGWLRDDAGWLERDAKPSTDTRIQREWVAVCNDTGWLEREGRLERDDANQQS